jgi:predicted outer membrane repeat protein
MIKKSTFMLALILALSVLAVCGCGSGPGGSAPPVPPSAAEPSATASEPSAHTSAYPRLAVESSGFPFAPTGDYGEDKTEPVNAGGVICVDGSSVGLQDGTPLNPYRTIQAAVDAASNGEIDTIKVARGIYRDAVRISQKKVRLLGGFAGSGDFSVADPQANSTIIEGTSAAPCVLVNLDERAISGSLVISGFTIRSGQRGIELMGAWSGYLDDIIIRSNIIEENGTNEDDQRGGGIGLEGSRVSILNNLIRGNKAVRGAAIGTTSDVSSDFLIADNLIMENMGYGDHAGGVLINGTGVITRNVFDGNVIDAGSANGYGWGGAITIVNYDTTKLIVLSHNIWRNNRAPSRGGAVFVDEAANVEMTNELFYGNTSGESGSAIYVDQAWTLEPSILSMGNCTVSGNSAGAALYVEASSAHIKDCIFWGNGNDFEVADGGKLTVDFTLSQQGHAGEGNITSDPLFADASAGDFHILSKNGRFVPSTGAFSDDGADSPAIDAGDPSSDFSKEPEPNGRRANLGCYGNTAEASKSSGT